MSVNAWLELHNFPTTFHLTSPTGDSHLEISTSVALAFIIVALTSFVFFSSGSSKAKVVRSVLTTERRSVEKFSGAASSNTVVRALEAAIRAPNHWLNEPWRFRILGVETIEKVKALGGEKKAALFNGVPGMLMVSVVPTIVDGSDKWNLKSLEDHAATAAAVQNFMLSLASEGVGSKWLTGKLGIPPTELMKLVSADENEEHFMGIIIFGKPVVPLGSAKRKVPKRKVGLASPVLTYCD